jgi:uncharacterized repeat protein (TIGR01451 family)
MASFLQPAEALLHGIGIAVGCEKVEVGDFNDCTFQISSIDFNAGDNLILETVVTNVEGVPISASAVGADMVVTDASAGTSGCTIGADVVDILGTCSLNGLGEFVEIRDRSHQTVSGGAKNYGVSTTATDTCGSGAGDCDPTQGAKNAATTAVFQVLAPAWEITKTPDADKVQPGDTINYTVEVTNTGNTAITGVNVSDPLLTLARQADNPGNDDDTLEPGETWVFTGSYVVDVDDCGTIDNTVEATGNFQLGEVDPISADASVAVVCPDWEITKTPDADKVEAGDTINYTVNLSNTGSADITGVVVNDALISLTREADNPGNDDDTLEPGETWVFSGSYVTTEQDCAEGVDNTVTADGATQLGDLDQISADASVDVLCPDWEITKVADVDTASPGDTINYTVELSNTGDTDITGVVVNDALISLTREADNPGNDDDTLEPGETWVFSGSYVVTEEDCAEGVNNTVTANGAIQLRDLDEISANESVEVECETFEGLTPGFWKANWIQWGGGAWVDELGTDKFNTVFNTNISVSLDRKQTASDPTLIQALSATGGVNYQKGVFDALARHCVAGKLNAENPDVNYFLSASEVIQACHDAITTNDAVIDGTHYTAATLKDLLDSNNNLGADISQHWPN